MPDNHQRYPAQKLRDTTGKSAYCIQPQVTLQMLVKDIERGIEGKIDYIINDVLTGVRVKRSDCNGSSLDPEKTLCVGLEGFNNKPINFEFAGTTGLKLMGTDKLSSNRLSSGILIEGMALATRAIMKPMAE